MFQGPANITIELSPVGYRGMVIGYTFVAWSVGYMSVPLAAYLINTWKALRAVCVLPFAFVFLCWTILPESPR